MLVYLHLLPNIICPERAMVTAKFDDLKSPVTAYKMGWIDAANVAGKEPGTASDSSIFLESNWLK
jgi:hypothetical protein